jgi:hypothetical protein
LPETRNSEFPFSTVTFEIGVPDRAEPSRNCNEAGIKRECNDEHSDSALASIFVSLDSGSNVNDERDLHPQKHSLWSVSTKAGMQID